MKPFYFYHLLPKCSKLDPGIVSLEYWYHNNIKIFRKNSQKYRDRLCSGWNIYPQKSPEDLTDEEVYNGINLFRGTENGCNQIYLFRFPPFRQLGLHMNRILNYKDIYRIDINLKDTQAYINSIDWGYELSYTGNEKLNRQWYEEIDKEDYFKKYDETKIIPYFAALNHISIIPKNNYLPKKLWIKIKTPVTMEDIITM